MFTTCTIKTHERGLAFLDGELDAVLAPGRHRLFDPWSRRAIHVVSERAPWLVHDDLDAIVRSGKLGDALVVVDLADGERALVWVDGRFDRILAPGRHAYFAAPRQVVIERVACEALRLVHPALSTILAASQATTSVGAVAVAGEAAGLVGLDVPVGHAAVLLRDGQLVEVLPPARYAYWEAAGRVEALLVDLRELTVDVAGQEIMTADKVTLRMNLVITYRVADPVRAVTTVQDYRSALYREAQLALRAIVGTRDIDVLLEQKDAAGAQLELALTARAEALGLAIVSAGVRDIILPGQMRDLLNKVTEAKKSAEAMAITRREETSAMRSQANTAKLLEQSPTLMRLRELEVVERLVGNTKLNLIIGDKGARQSLIDLV